MLSTSTTKLATQSIENSTCIFNLYMRKEKKEKKSHKAKRLNAFLIFIWLL